MPVLSEDGGSDIGNDAYAVVPTTAGVMGYCVPDLPAGCCLHDAEHQESFAQVACILDQSQRCIFDAAACGWRPNASISGR